MTFARAGYTATAIGHQVLRTVGREADIWSLVASSSTRARYLYLDPESTYPSYSYNRSDAYPLRCLMLLG